MKKIQSTPTKVLKYPEKDGIKEKLYLNKFCFTRIRKREDFKNYLCSKQCLYKRLFGSRHIAGWKQIARLKFNELREYSIKNILLNNNRRYYCGDFNEISIVKRYVFEQSAAKFLFLRKTFNDYSLWKQVFKNRSVKIYFLK